MELLGWWWSVYCCLLIMSDTAIKIRKAEPGDVEAIIRMINGMASYEHLEHLVEITEEKLQESLFCEKPVAFALVATDEAGEVRGYAIYFYTYSTFIGKPGIYLEDLYVDVEYRGQGYGNALFMEVARTAKREDCGRMEWMALDWNEPALNFYKAKGAKVLDEWKLLRLTKSELAEIA